MKKNTIGMKLMKTAMALAAAAFVFYGAGTVSMAYTETEGKVTVDTAKIRESADTGSSVQGLVDKGSTVTIIDETTDSSGTLWYKVKKGDIVGFVRSDLLEKGAPIATAEETTEAPAAESAATELADGVSAMAPQYAEVAVDSGKMRSGASTKDSIVTTLDKGSQVVVSGQTTGSDGKTWYYVSATGGDGSASMGYVRSDLVTLGEMIPQEETVEEQPMEEVAEEPVAAAPVENKDYEVVYTDDGSGQQVWYLYDHKNNNRLKLEELLKYADTQAKKASEAEASVKKLKVVLIILAVLLVAAIIALVIFGLKLRDAYYETYDDEDDEDDDDDDEDDDDDDEDDDDDDEDDVRIARGRRITSREKSPSPERMTSKKIPTEHGSADEGVRRPAPAKRPAKEVTYDESQDLKVDGAVKQAAPRKTKNFLMDDDDFEFEFLNMDK